MLKKLLVLSFIEGAAVMAAELCGAKLLAPVFGSSLYVWASVMGITLTALALGYFFGGRLCTETARLSTYLFRVLIAASLFVILMPVLAHYLIPRISYLPFLLAVVLSTGIQLFAPVFFLGASSPMLIALQTGDQNSGRVSGTVYAVSTFGGILSTFLCGFFLIPKLGLTTCLVSFGAGLFISTIIVFKRYKPFQLFLFFCILYLNLQIGFRTAKQLFVCDGMLGHLEVETYENGKQDSVRILKINNIIQTEMSLSSHGSVSDYVRLLDTLIQPCSPTGAALVMGLGGGLTANLLIHKNYQVDGVELDERIIQAAHSYFYLNPQVQTFGLDARYFLNRCPKKYDLVLMDVFKAEEQPWHVLTLESLEKLKGNLKPQALVLINWHGYVQDHRGLGTSILYNTLLRSGFHVTLCSMSSLENSRNIVFVASLGNRSPFPFQLKETLASTDLLNTDDFPLLEMYNAEANKSWRSNYLRYYQSQSLK